ncbi:MAG: NADH-quinone oxidoreductase subunit C [Deltaproteobacteria bacterium]|nr:NADH-quinone oxidoreductase subunit C [Deltaproteobacteria bacterium]
MSKALLDHLGSLLGDKLLETTDHRGDEVAIVAPADWYRAAEYLRRDEKLGMTQFTDLTAVDYPERAPDEPRFDLLLFVRNPSVGKRLRLKTRVADGKSVASLTDLWAGANWAEREAFDMFGIVFDGHPDLRRILLYPEFQGHPLRKDYPIDQAQPLVPYRDADDTHKLPPFGIEEGQPFGRTDWSRRLQGLDDQVSPSLALAAGQRASLSSVEAHTPEAAPEPAVDAANEA